MLDQKKDDSKICRILSLDGGGAKGFYTLGVLREIEALVGGNLHEKFDLFYGTSTGSIIATLLALGNNVEDVHKLYRTHVPTVMKAKNASGKSTELAALANDVFGERRFDAVHPALGIVTTKWLFETPMIFKNRGSQAHGRENTFTPGFGCTLSEAIQASCSAYPFFNKKIVITEAGDEVLLADGGYCANNPTLFALADAVAGFAINPEQCRVVSVGCGNYPEPKPSLMMRFARRYLKSVQLLEKTLDINTASMEQLQRVLFKHVPTIRISDTFDKPSMATNLFECDLQKLNILRQRGAESYGTREAEIKQLLFNE